jgi:uncharacterized protein YhaN
MRIQQLSLIRYGKFTDRVINLPRADQDLHVIVGPNEAGKSTMRAAIGDLLFGIPLRTPLAFLHPMPELRLGALLEEDGQFLAMHRTKGNKQTLRSPEDVPLADTALLPWLGESSRTFFEQMFALDHEALVRGGDGILSAADDLGRMLFQSATGMEHLGRVLKELEAEKDALWAPRKASSRAYYTALDAYDRATAELKTTSIRPKVWKEHLEKHQQTAEALDAAQTRHTTVRTRRSQLERIRRIGPVLRAFDAARNGLDALGPVPLLPPDAATLLIEADREQALADAEIERHSAGMENARKALSEIHVEHTLLALGAEIQELDERRLQYRSHRADMHKREEEVQTLWQEVQTLATGLGWPAEHEEALRRRLPSPALRARLTGLVHRHAPLEQARQSSTRQHNDRQQELNQALQACATLPVDAVSPALQAALERARRLGDHALQLQELRTRCDKLAAEVETALAQLGPWRAEPHTLRAMLVPQGHVVQELLNGQRSDTPGLQAAEKHLAARQAEQAQCQLELDQLVRTYQPVSREDVIAARLARDTAWKTFKASPGSLPPAQALAHEHLVAHADALADTRLEKIQHEADRQAQTQRLEILALGIEQEQTHVTSVRQRLAQRQQHWRDLAQACALPGLPLELAPGWLDLRQAALDALATLALAHQTRDRQIEAGEEARLALNAALPRLSHSETSLEESIRAAEIQIEQSTQGRGQRATLEKQIAQARKTLITLQSACEAAQQEWQAWCDDWQQAYAATGYEAGTPVDQLGRDLDDMGRMAQALEKIQAIRVDRIQAMRADLDALDRLAQDLACRIKPELQGKPAEEIVLALVAQLSAARTTEAEVQRLEQQLNSARTGLEQAQARLSTVRSKLAPLNATAGTQNRETLAHAIEQSGQRRSLEQALFRASTALEEGSDGLTPAELRKEVESMEAADAALQLEQLGLQEDRVVSDIRTLSAELQQASVALAAFDGSDKAARAESARQDAIAQMSLAVERYLKLHTASKLLRWSIDRYRQTRQGPMLSRASDIFADLTLGSFSRLVVDFEGEIPKLQGHKSGDKLVGVEGMSEGTRDQLYLALRLAALDMHVGQARALPFIADDLFINFDDRRTAAGLKVLGELSRKTQVLFLTHHDHLLPLIHEVLGSEVNVETL